MRKSDRICKSGRLFPALLIMIGASHVVNLKRTPANEVYTLLLGGQYSGSDSSGLLQLNVEMSRSRRRSIPVSRGLPSQGGLGSLTTNFMYSTKQSTKYVQSKQRSP
ncbi:hypothetical protein BDV12DRAFT_168109 [Aspergillus spectabilis]